MRRRDVLGLVAAAVAAPFAFPGAAPASTPPDARAVLMKWYHMVFELVRHTPTCSPPYAARAYAYIAITAYEVVASGRPGMRSLAGQVTGLAPLPQRDPNLTYDEAVVLQTALAKVVDVMFAHTGPTGQMAKKAFAQRQLDTLVADVAFDIASMSETYGAALADHVLAWAAVDGGADVDNMGFPRAHDMPTGPEFWVPTSTIRIQQYPLLPNWGKEMRLFLTGTGTGPVLPPPSAYSEEKGSAFYTQALEVYDTGNNLTKDQYDLAMFWSDDPLLTVTPAGHGTSIAVQILDQVQAPLERCVDVLARLGVAQADAMTVCWREKYVYNRLRPITYIQRVIDPAWQPLLITPPFPEYPSGHSVQAGSFGAVMTDLFGENFAFTDHTGEADNFAPRSFPDFQAAALEAGMSRLYGGIHFRAAIEEGLKFGHAIGLYATALKTVTA